MVNKDQAAQALRLVSVNGRDLSLIDQKRLRIAYDYLTDANTLLPQPPASDKALNWIECLENNSLESWGGLEYAEEEYHTKYGEYYNG